MALNGQFVNIDHIIDGVYRDFGFEETLNWVDVVEHIGDALDLIGANSQLIDKVTDGNTDLKHHCPVVIKNYRGVLPCDMVFHTQIQEEKTGMMLRETSDSMHLNIADSEKNLPAQSLTWYGTLEFSSPLLTVDNIVKNHCETDLTYKISGCYIHTNFEEGNLVIAYKAMMMDEEGAPMIPDNIKYILAVKHYVAEKIAQKLWIKGKLTGDKFQWFQRERDWYMGAATNAGNIPSVDKMQTWTNMFTRLIPDMNAHDTGFRYIGSKEKRNTHNSI